MPTAYISLTAILLCRRSLCSESKMSTVTPPSEENELESFLFKSSLDLESIDTNTFRSKNLWQQKVAKGTYGGHIIGQAMVAASKNIPDNQKLHSLHSYFLQPGKSNNPILYHVEKTRDGRTYMSRNIKATQHGKTLFTMEASFKVPEDTSFSYQLPKKDVPSVEELPDYMDALGTLKEQGEITELQYQASKDWFNPLPVEMKWIDIKEAAYSSPRHPSRSLWFRAKGRIAEDVHHNIHKCCIGYMLDTFLTSTALLPLAPLMGKRILLASLDHCMWFHTPCRADEWMFLDVTVEFIGDGRTLSRSLVWNQQGDLVTTITQEGLQRVEPKL